VIVMGRFNRFSVFTGIDDDPIVSEIPAQDAGWLAGGRVRPMEELPQALAAHPPYPYILIDTVPPPSMDLPPAGYEEIFSDEGLHLYRLRSG